MPVLGAWTPYWTPVQLGPADLTVRSYKNSSSEDLCHRKDEFRNVGATATTRAQGAVYFNSQSFYNRADGILKETDDVRSSCIVKILFVLWSHSPFFSFVSFIASFRSFHGVVLLAMSLCRSIHVTILCGHEAFPSVIGFRLHPLFFNIYLFAFPTSPFRWGILFSSSLRLLCSF
jgi:hypothetical protein